MFKIYVLIFILICGCYSVNSNTTVDKDLRSGYTTSLPVHLSFKNTKKASFYFILKHKVASEDYFIHVRWVNYGASTLFNGLNTQLTFLIDNMEVIDLFPVRLPKIVAFNIESKGYEEEAVFKLNEVQLRKIAYAKYVDAELIGKYISVIGSFNKYHTFRAFKDFAESDSNLSYIGS